MAVTIDKAKIGVCFLGFLGILLLVIGIAAFSLLPTIFKEKLKENLVLEEGKDTFDKWQLTPIPVYFTVYLFDCVNHDDVYRNGDKPQLEEVGPFIYKQQRSKNVRGFDPATHTVLYDDIKTYQFVESMSADLDQVVHALNMPMLGMTKMVDKVPFFVRGMAATVVNGFFDSYKEGLFINRTARQLLFEGYKVDLIQDLIDLVKPFTKIENPLPNNTFGFLYDKNNTGDGTFSIYTGEDDIEKYTQILTWNNHTRLSWWKDQYCDMLNGTDGAQFAPPVAKTDILYVYTAELCRSVYLEFLEEVHVKGILAYRFTTPTRLFASPHQNPDNQCYCTKPSLCYLSGILDITSCRKGIPLGVTAPHFHLAHPDISERVEGLKPDKEAHETWVDIEPTTGFVLRASRKLQMNFFLEHSSKFRLTENVTSVIFPLLWITESAEVSDELASEFTSKVKTPLTIAKSILTACIVLGLLWIVTAAFVTVYILIKQQKASKGKLKATYKAVPLKPGDVNPKMEKASSVNI